MQERDCHSFRTTFQGLCQRANTAIPAPVPSGGRGGGCGKDAPLVAAVAGAVEDVGAGVDDGRGRPGVPVPHNGVEGGSGAQDPHSLDLVDLQRCECIIINQPINLLRHDVLINRRTSNRG